VKPTPTPQLSIEQINQVRPLKLNGSRGAVAQASRNFFLIYSLIKDGATSTFVETNTQFTFCFFHTSDSSNFLSIQYVKYTIS